MNLGFGTRVGLFILRVLVGVRFLLAAWEKIWPGFNFSSFAQGWLKQPSLAGQLKTFSENVRPEIGFYKNLLVDTFIPHANTLTYCVVFGEILVGIALVLGLLTRIAGSFGAFMTAAFFLTTWQAGPIAPMTIRNPAFITMTLCLVIILSGAGLWGGLDARLRRPRA